jgi:hypothetical protein
MQGAAFTGFPSISLFLAMQEGCFYRFSFNLVFSGNAERLLLPVFLQDHIFGQCRSSAFTGFPSISFFRAMQKLCFYRFSFNFAFSGNAGGLLLPFFLQARIFGQCRRAAFTVFHSSSLFRTMQRGLAKILRNKKHTKRRNV